MQEVKVGCITVGQTVNINTTSLKIKRFIKNNKIALIISGMAIVLLSIYVELIINFINLIKIIY